MEMLYGEMFEFIPQLALIWLYATTSKDNIRYLVALDWLASWLAVSKTIYLSSQCELFLFCF